MVINQHKPVYLLSIEEEKKKRKMKRSGENETKLNGSLKKRKVEVRNEISIL